MARPEKTAAVAEIVESFSDAAGAVLTEYRGLTVKQLQELRRSLGANANYAVVKNTLTERAADQADAPALKPMLAGPTALTFVRGDVALAAKAVSDYGKATELLAFKGGLMNGEAIEPDQIQALAKLPSRQVLYGQLVGLVASLIALAAGAAAAMLASAARGAAGCATIAMPLS